MTTQIPSACDKNPIYKLEISDYAIPMGILLEVIGSVLARRNTHMNFIQWGKKKLVGTRQESLRGFISTRSAQPELFPKV